MEFGKVKFFFKTMLGAEGSLLTASTTETAGFFDVDHLQDWLETFSWKAADDVDPVTITHDAGVGNAPTSDYLAIRRHNLGTLGASVALQNSTDNFATDVDTVAAVLATGNRVLFDETRVIPNRGQEVWQEGIVSIEATGWVVTGGGTVDRESTIVKTGLYSAKVTRSATDAFYKSSITNFAFYAGKQITIGAWVHSSLASSTKLFISDGVGTSTSAHHSGTPGWEFLTVTRTIDGSPTELEVGMQVELDTVSYLDTMIFREGATVVSTDISDPIQPQSNGKRYWRLKITDDSNPTFSAPPSMAIAVWGDKVELDHVSVPFDPNAEEPEVNINRSFGGLVTGVHTKFTDRVFTLGFTNKDPEFYAKVDDWWQTHGQQQLFVGWNTNGYPDQVWLMFPDGQFRNPRSASGENDRRFITIDLRGVKE